MAALSDTLTPSRHAMIADAPHTLASVDDLVEPEACGSILGQRDGIR
jgi:hypothetical protein